MATVKDRVEKPRGYGKTSRFYTIKGQDLPSVTTILRAIDKPALIPWAAKVERESCISTAWDIYQNAKQGPILSTQQAFQEHFSLRLGQEKAHARKMREAADLGSEAHARIEWEIKKELGQDPGPEPPIRDEALWAVMACQDWRKKANMVPLMTEEVVYSERYGYAGTMDVAAEFDTFEHGRIHSVVDFKSSVGIYPEMMLQIAAYAHALVEMGQATAPYGTIVRIPKDPGKESAVEVRTITPDEVKKLHKVFLAVKDLWEYLEGAK